MRDDSNRVRPRRQSQRRLAAEAARELRLLSLSEGLSFCVLLRDRRDPRFEEEMQGWLGRARRECGLRDEDGVLLRAAVVAREGEFRELALEVIERAHRRLRATGSRSVLRSGRSHPRLRRDSKLPARIAGARLAARAMKQSPLSGYRPPRPRLPDSATARLALVGAAACLASGFSVMAARGDSMMVARSGPDINVARRVAPPSKQDRCPIPARLRGAFVVAAKQTDLPLPLLVAVARAESHFDTTAHSDAGAIGVLQLMPATARAMGVDPTDPEANVVAGARYLRSLFSRFGSSQLALAAYYAGPTSVAAGAGALRTETQAYVANVRRTWRSLRGCR